MTRYAAPPSSVQAITSVWMRAGYFYWFSVLDLGINKMKKGFLIVNIMALQLHLLTMFFPEKYVTLPYDLAEQIGTCPII